MFWRRRVAHWRRVSHHPSLSHWWWLVLTHLGRSLAHLRRLLTHLGWLSHHWRLAHHWGLSHHRWFHSHWRWLVRLHSSHGGNPSFSCHHSHWWGQSHPHRRGHSGTHSSWGFAGKVDWRSHVRFIHLVHFGDASCSFSNFELSQVSHW